MILSPVPSLQLYRFFLVIIYLLFSNSKFLLFFSDALLPSYHGCHWVVPSFLLYSFFFILRSHVCFPRLQRSCHVCPAWCTSGFGYCSSELLAHVNSLLPSFDRHVLIYSDEKFDISQNCKRTFISLLLFSVQDCLLFFEGRLDPVYLALIRVKSYPASMCDHLRPLHESCITISARRLNGCSGCRTLELQCPIPMTGSAFAWRLEAMGQ